MSDLDPKLTFDSFVVGPANRLASAAARRAADSPGTSYNPLFLYSAPGLGKTHILTAIAHHSSKAKAGKVEYMALEEYLEKLEVSLQAGQRDGLYGDLDILTAADTPIDSYYMLNAAPSFKKTMLNEKHALEMQYSVGRVPSAPLRATTETTTTRTFDEEGDAPPAAG